MANSPDPASVHDDASPHVAQIIFQKLNELDNETISSVVIGTVSKCGNFCKHLNNSREKSTTTLLLKAN